MVDGESCISDIAVIDSILINCMSDAITVLDAEEIPCIEGSGTSECFRLTPRRDMIHITDVDDCTTGYVVYFNYSDKGWHR